MAGIGTVASKWKIIRPIGAATLNLITNPSFETGTTGWTAVAPNPNPTRSTAQSYRGVASGLCTDNGNEVVAQYAITAPAASTYRFYVAVYVPATWDGGDIFPAAIGFPGITVAEIARWTAADGYATWYTIQLSITTAGGGAGTVSVRRSAAATPGRQIYIDAANFYEANTFYTYWDGDQPGAEWLGVRHASVSRASGVTRRIGEVLDLREDFRCAVSERMGTGTEALAITRDEYALLPGGQRNNTKQLERVFTLMCAWDNEPVACDYHTTRAALIAELAHDAYPKDSGGWQQVTVRYTGATTTKEIVADYEADIGNTFAARLPLRAWPLRFRATNPFWYALDDTGAVLDSSDADTFYYVARRSTRGDGQWNNLGIANNPIGGGNVEAVLYASDGTVYLGGTFTGFNNNAGDDYIIQYNPVSGAFTTVGAAGDLNGAVYGLAETAGGDIIVAGAFTNAAGIAAADYVARWDGTNWNAVGAPVAGAAVINSVRAVIVRANGNYVVGGDFTNFANVANADYIAEWNGAAWIAPGGVLAFNGIVYALAERTNGNYYAGGAFTTVTGGACLRLAEFNGTAWAQVSSGLNNNARGLAYDPVRDELFIAGQFTQDGGAAITLNYAAKWDNQSLQALGSGLGAAAFVCTYAPDGEVWFGGSFTTAGGITLVESVARWTGNSWLPIDAEFNTAGAPSILSIDFSPVDPVVVANYNPYVGFTTTGAGTKAGLTTVTNPGTQRAFPQLQIGRSGGTSARVISMRNETTGLELLFDYTLLDGEQLLVELEPTKKTVTSNYRGDQPGAMLPASDFGQWALLPGDNEVTFFVVTDATVTVQLLWRAPYKSIDD